jgi:hypothetical protein
MIQNEHRKTGRIDLEATETALRLVMRDAGAAMLTKLLQFPAPADDQRNLPCGCGQQAHYRELRARGFLSVLGETEVSRPYYLCKHCGTGQSPVDRDLDIEKKEHSPGLRRMEAFVGQAAPFKNGREQLKVLAGIEVTVKAVERTAEETGADIAARHQQEIDRFMQLKLPVIVGKKYPFMYIEMDGTGINVVKKETVGHQGKIAGKPSHTREVKLGCVFTQSEWNAEGFAIRAPDSTSYVGAIETAEEFGHRIYAEAWNRDWANAEKKVVIADGAAWIWNLADQHFPGAMQIVDQYHAREHLWELARKLYPNDEAKQKDWMKIHQPLLDNGKMKKLTVALRAIAAANPALAEKFRTEADYFHRNALRMRYPKFRRLHLFVGSGVIEAGCRTVIGERLKQSGMFWTVSGANKIIALRCCYLNGRFEDHWENWRAA